MSRLEIIESDADFRRALKEIEKSEWISFDTETGGLNPFATDAYLTSLGIGTLTRDWTFPLDHYKGKLFGDRQGQITRVRKIHEVVEYKEKAAHNGKFDSLFLKQVFGVMWWVDFDTMLAHYNLNENEWHGLDILATKYLGAEEYDIPLEWKHGRAGTLQKHCEYLGLDCEHVTRLRKRFTRMLNEEPNADKLFRNLTMPVAKLYTKIELRGVPINEKQLKDGRRYWQEIAERSHRELNKLTKNYTPPPNKKGKVLDLNFGSPQQLSDLLFRHFKLKPLDKTPKGANSTSESVLKRLDHPICKHILDNREATKNLGTFIESWRSRLDNKGRIHPSFKVHGTVTGRPACEEPNLQATPRDPRIRSIINADELPDWVMMEWDYSQAELRIAADLANEPTLRQAYQTGEDVHTKTVQEIFGIMKPTPEERKKAKAVNFGFLYGMWWKKFIIYARDNYGATFTEKEAEQIRKNFFKLYNALPKWHDKQKKLARSQGYVINKIGRKRRLPDATRPDTGQYDPMRGEAERQAINSPVQSLASDINLLASVEIDNKIDNDYCQIVGTIHDAILILIRKDKLDYCARKIKKIMENPEALHKIFKCTLAVPLVAEAKVGAWSKGVPYDFS